MRHTILDYVIIYSPSVESIVLLTAIKLLFRRFPQQEWLTPFRMPIDIRAEDAKSRGGVDIRRT